MFEAAEIGAKVPKRDYLAALPQLRTDLINAQFDLEKAGGRDLRPQLVRPGARRTRRGVRSRSGVKRAYEEINDFEENLVERGFVLQKFWMHIDREEPLLAAQGDADA